MEALPWWLMTVHSSPNREKQPPRAGLGNLLEEPDANLANATSRNKYVWEESQEIAFRTLKEKLMSKPILQYPDFSREFILTIDASNDGEGAVLSQKEIGKVLPIALASCSFNKAERNYSTVEKELASIV
jgi:hypothetical protein